MKYEDIREGKFIARPNRFVARVLVDGKEELCHVKNTGRCLELLVPGAKVYLERPHGSSQKHGSARKTLYDVVAVYKKDVLFNIDSFAPNIAAGEYLRGCFPGSSLRAEKTFGNSRFDFYIETPENKIYAEVKGVTLEYQGVAFFPDAPTKRGVKHLSELIRAREEGYGAILLFIVQMKGTRGFLPNDKTDPDFGRMLREARKKGVEIRALECEVQKDGMTVLDELPLLF